MAARVERLAWRDVPVGEIELPKETLRLTLGLGSGLSARGGRVFAVTDRGPNLFVSDAAGRYGLRQFDGPSVARDAKILPMPETDPEIAELAVQAGEVRLIARKALRTRSGARFSGRAPSGAGMEQLFDLQGRPLPSDPLGADMEAIAAMPDGGFFLAEEYGPSLLKTDNDGVVSERWVPAGLEAMFAHPDVEVRGVLPGRSKLRRGNRGFEALCVSGDGAWLYAGFQSALVGENQRQAPIWKLDAASGALADEYLYPFDEPSTFQRDAQRRKVDWSDLKICEFVWAGKDRLIVLERIAHTSKVYAVDLTQLAEKQLLISSDDFPEIGSDIEGMAALSQHEMLLVSDNDFGVEGAETGFWRVRFDEPLM
jgi:hypothetical protein